MSVDAVRDKGIPLSTPVAGQGSVPSGQTVRLLEVLVDEVAAENWLRFRFLAPEIDRTGGGLSFEAIEPDFEYLCREVALPYLAEYDLSPDLVAITLLDREVPFGSTDPDATQFIEVFRVAGGTCVWEGF